MYIPASDGRWIDENFARLAEIVHDYEPTLELRWIPTDKRTRDDKKPYVIVDTRINQAVLYASEIDTPVDILAKLFDADNKNGSVLTRIENHNRAVEIFEAKKRLEQMEEAMDEASFLFKSPLNFVNFKGKKLDSERRVIGPTGGRTYL